MMMKKRSYSIGFLAAMIIMLTGCYPKGPEFIEDLDVVLTNFESGYDFRSKQTYALPDRIVMITGDKRQGEDPEYIPDATASLILAQIDKNMTALGWQKVGVDQSPDLLLEPASLESTTTLYYYDYWYWWYGAYYPWWGYYPVSATSYSTGTLLMRLIDPEAVGANGRPVVQWTGAANGIMAWSYNSTRINKAIDQAFSQSPYLKTN